jgi:hypothetical protein
MSVRTPAILTEGARGYPQSLQANAGVLHRVHQGYLLSEIYNSSLILPYTYSLDYGDQIKNEIGGACGTYGGKGEVHVRFW